MRLRVQESKPISSHVMSRHATTRRATPRHASHHVTTSPRHHVTTSPRHHVTTSRHIDDQVIDNKTNKPIKLKIIAVNLSNIYLIQSSKNKLKKQN